MIKYLPNSKATFKNMKLQSSQPGYVQIPRGTPVTARAKLKHGQMSVMYLTPRQTQSQQDSLREALKALNMNVE